MSKIQLTLTEDHYDKRVAHEEGWIDEDDPEVTLRLYYLFHPLTLEFELPSPWRTDFENAPKDGRFVMFMVGRSPMVVSYFKGAWMLLDDPEEIHVGETSTTWMEIPALPERV